MRNLIIVIMLIATITPLAAAYDNVYDVNITNDGTQLPRYNELIRIPLSTVDTYHTNKTDVLLKNSLDEAVPFEYINNLTEIAFTANLTTATTTGYKLYTNDSSVSGYDNNQTFMHIVMTESSQNGNTPDADMDGDTCAAGGVWGVGGTAGTVNYSSSYAYRGDEGIAYYAGTGGGTTTCGFNSAGTGTIYASLYMRDSASTSQAQFQLGQNSANLVLNTYSNYNAVTHATNGVMSGTDSNTWSARNFNISLTTINTGTVENLTGYVVNGSSIGKQSGSPAEWTYLSLVQNGVASYVMFDEIIVSTSPITQYINYSVVSVLPYEAASETVFNATNADTSAVINSFSVDVDFVNGSSQLYTTTNGTINAQIAAGEVVNTTISSSGYLTQIINNLEIGVYTTFNLTPINYFEITAIDVNTTNAIQEISASVTNSTGTTTDEYSVSDGSIVTDVVQAYGELYNISVSSDYYVAQTINDYNTTADLEFNLTPYNSTQTLNVSDPHDLLIDMVDTIDLDDYFDYSTRYEIEVFFIVDGVNGTGTRLGNSTGVYEDTTAYYEVSFDNQTISITPINAAYNWSIRLFSYDVSGYERAQQRFTVIQTDNPQTANEMLLGFDFDVGDGRFWLFMIFSAAVIILCMTMREPLLYYMGTIWFFFWGVSFMVAEVSIFYGAMMLFFSILLLGVTFVDKQR